MTAPQYLPSPNKPPLNPVKALIGIILLLAIGALLHGCNPAKRTQRLDTKALNRVVTNPTLLNDAGNVFLKLNPCVVLTVKEDSIIFHNDTIIAEKKVIIPRIVSKNRNIDTIIDNISIFINDSIIAVKSLEGERVITKNITKVIVDQSLVNRLKDTVDKKQRTIDTQYGENTELRTQISQYRNTINKKDALIIGLLVALALSVFFNVKGLFSKIVPKFTI